MPRRSTCAVSSPWAGLSCTTVALLAAAAMVVTSVASLAVQPCNRSVQMKYDFVSPSGEVASPLLLTPTVAVQGSEVTSGACLARRDDRLVITGGTKKSIQWNRPDGRYEFWFLASDLCAMGHTTKDPAHLASFLLDFAAQAKLRRKPCNVSLTVVYGNLCMLRNAGQAGGNKRSAVFLQVLRGWFHAVLRRDSPIVRALGDSGVHLDGSSVVTIDHEPNQHVALAGTELYAVDAVRSLESLKCHKTPVEMVKRSERWRWFRTASHAQQFRESILHHYRITSTPSPRWPVNTVVLRRDEDRHFDEADVVKFLKQRFSGIAHVTLHTFDKYRGSQAKPPPHREQLSILHNASILIAAHGAGLSNVVAMMPGSVVVELFPHNFRYYMYEELAVLLGIKYMGFESPVVWPPKCCSGRGSDSMPSIREPIPSLVNGVGARACKKCNIRISFWEWETILRTALFHAVASASP